MRSKYIIIRDNSLCNKDSKFKIDENWSYDSKPIGRLQHIIRRLDNCILRILFNATTKHFSTSFKYTNSLSKINKKAKMPKICIKSPEVVMAGE